MHHSLPRSLPAAARRLLLPSLFAIVAALTLMLAACGQAQAQVPGGSAPGGTASAGSSSGAATYDLVVAGARVMDPESGFDGVADIGIKGDRIAAISAAPLEGKERVLAAGYVAAPGFIDMDTISYPKPADYRAIEHWKLTDGVTSTLYLHDGSPSVEYIRKAFAKRTHITNWGYGLRVIALYELSKSQKEREKILDEELSKGGLSVGMSPEYNPGLTTEELIGFAKVAKKHGAPVLIHTRYAFKQDELKGVEEALRIARESGAHVHILHIASTGATWHMAEALSMLEKARAEGVDIDSSVYPYTYWMTPISNPNRFGKGWQEGLGLDYSDLYFVPLKRRLTKELFDEYRWKGGLVVVPEGTISLEKSLLPALAMDWIMIGSDGSHEQFPGSHTGVAGHPRDSGNFADCIAFAREHGIPLMTMLGKMTVLPAKLLERRDGEFALRGRLKVGAYADIAIFDPETARAGGTIDDPAVESKGILAVVLNGKLAYSLGKVDPADYGVLLDAK